MIEIINHKELAISRLLTQYRESINLINYIETLLTEADKLEDVFHTLLNDRYIDTAYGIQLDILGEIVGQSRNIKNAFIHQYFGFQDGGQHVGGFGYKFYVSGDPFYSNLTLGDDEYRFLIHARAMRNRFDGTIEGMIEFIKFAFSAAYCAVIEQENATADIIIGKILTDQEKALIIFSDDNDFVPKPAGVRFNYFEAAENGIFGFEANPVPGLVSGFGQGSFVSSIT